MMDDSSGDTYFGPKDLSLSEREPYEAWRRISENLGLIGDPPENIFVDITVNDGKEPRTKRRRCEVGHDREKLDSGQDQKSEGDLGLYPIKTGTLVWGLWPHKRNSSKRYLGITIPTLPILQSNDLQYKRYIYWLEDEKVSLIRTKNIAHCLDPKVYKEKIPLAKEGVTAAVKVIQEMYTLDAPAKKPKNVEQFVSWIDENRSLLTNCSYVIPRTIMKRIEDICYKAIETDPEEESRSAKSDEIRSTKFSINYDARDPETMCFGCREVVPMKEPHPLVQGFLCSNCYVRVQENLNVLKLNRKACRYCSLCGWLDKYMYCKTCCRVICRTCMMFWFSEETYKSVARAGYKWDCLFCMQPSEHPMIKSKITIKNLNGNSEGFRSLYVRPCEGEVELQEVSSGMRVLSLFDGICTGMVALTNLNVKVEKYYAAETDSDALAVAKARFGDQVDFIGDVRALEMHQLKQLLPIHLLIGGSPCNELSKVNHRRKGLTDMSGSGPLFFEYFRILKLLDQLQGQGQTRHFYYLYENVSSMDLEEKETISRFFGSDPIHIDASFLSAMHRERLFWGNIPGLRQLDKNVLQTVRDDNRSTLQEHLTPNLDREATVKQIRTVTTNKNSLSKNDGSPQVLMDGEPSIVSVNEVEKIFGFPEHYTDVLDLSIPKRRKLLGKAWCVNVIEALLKPLTKVFPLNTPVQDAQVHTEDSQNESASFSQPSTSFASPKGVNLPSLKANDLPSRAKPSTTTILRAYRHRRLKLCVRKIPKSQREEVPK